MGEHAVNKLFACLVASVASISGAAVAADLPVKAPPYRAPLAYDWTGFYIGAHAGGGWADKHWFDATGPTLDEGAHTASGWLAGGQLGYNRQIGAWVFGLEVQASAADLDGSAVSNVFPTDRIRSRVDALGTFAGRIGYAADRALLYVKGGGAWAHDKFSITDIPTGITYAHFDQTRLGWMLGGGVEYAVVGNWSAKVEYNYMDLGTERSSNVLCNPNFGCVGPGGSFNEDVAQRMHVVKAGINYRFGAP
jgi:outer membrane immunogenic protein